jgi:probable rRNA maturation factor
MSVEVANESGVEVDVASLQVQARFLLDRLRIHPQADLSVVLVDEPAMTELHVRWMDEPGPTDVLSFPMDELRPPKDDDEDPPEGLLGDVVLCPQVALRQAEVAGHAMADELALLLTHGVLHLLGYDHAEPEEQREMFGLQARLLAEWVAERAGGSAP